MICSFYANWVITKLQLHFEYDHSFPLLHVVLVIPGVIMLLANFKPQISASLLLAASSVTIFDILQQILWVWLEYGSLYINELMVKKLAMSVLLPSTRKWKSAPVKGAKTRRASRSRTSNGTSETQHSRSFFLQLSVYATPCSAPAPPNNTCTGCH